MEDFVSRTEFENLKKEVADIKTELNKNTEILSKIDKKVTIISEKLDTSDEITVLKIKPIEDRVVKIENNISWLWKLCASIIVTGIIGAVISFK